MEGSGVDGEGGWTAKGRLYHPLGLFRLAMSPRSASHRPKNALDGLRDVSLPLGSISDPCLPCSALHGFYCLSHGFTWSAKLALEKQTSQPSLVMPL